MLEGDGVEFNRVLVFNNVSDVWCWYIALL
jgi:hypothetical protein